LSLITGVLERKEGDIWISVLAVSGNDKVVNTNSKGEAEIKKCQFTNYVLDIIECKPLEAGKVTITAANIAKDIEKDSHSSVYGILFDTGIFRYVVRDF